MWCPWDKFLFSLNLNLCLALLVMRFLPNTILPSPNSPQWKTEIHFPQWLICSYFVLLWYSWQRFSSKYFTHFFFFLSTWCSTLQCLVALILSDNRHCWIPLGFGQVSHRLCETQMKIWCFYRSKWEVTLLINNLLEKHRCERAHYFSWRKRSALLPQMDQRLHRGSGWKHSTDSPLPWISIFLHLHTCIQYKLETCSYF